MSSKSQQLLKEEKTIEVSLKYCKFQTVFERDVLSKINNHCLDVYQLMTKV